MIEIKNITKAYGKNAGNFDISFNVKEGDVYGIVGPNGSGKTTLIRQILGFIKSDSGSVSINSFDSWKQRQDIMEFTGYVAGENSNYENLTADQYLNVVSYLKNDPDKEYLKYLINYFELESRHVMKNMSKGNKQKVAIIAALLHKPKVLVLDEPTSALDPLMQHLFKKIIKQYRQEYNTTIIICSHVLSEISSLATRVGFIKKGRLIKEMDVSTSDTQKLEDTFIKLYDKQLDIPKNEDK